MSKLLTLPLPPSANHAWVTTRQGKRFLSADGKHFKQQVKQTILLTPDLHLDPDVGVSLRIDLYFRRQDILSSTWPKEAKRRYKRLDTSNRIKLLEDAVFEAIGVDDSIVNDVHIRRHILLEGDPYSTVEILPDEQDRAEADRARGGAVIPPSVNRR